MSSLFDASAYRRAKLGDFDGIGERIWPTACWLLHQGSDVLVYRNADAAKGISRAQHRLFTALSHVGDRCQTCGEMPNHSVQVVACTGLPGVTFDRQIAVYDHMHNDDKLRLAQDGEIGRFIADWFRAREGRR